MGFFVSLLLFVGVFAFYNIGKGRRMYTFWLPLLVSVLAFVFISSYDLQSDNFTRLAFLLDFIILFLFIAAFNWRAEEHTGINKNLAAEYKVNFDSLEQMKKKEIKVREENDSLSNQLENTSSVYNSILEMSATLDFRETLNAFMKSLGKMDGFQEAVLILNLPDPELNGEKKISSFRYHHQKDAVVEYESGNHEEVLLSRIKGERKFQVVSDCLAFGLIPGSFGIDNDKKAIVTPLFFQDEFSGGLIFFSEKKIYFDQLELLSLHFSMEVHKSSLYEKIKLLSTIDSLSGVYLKRHFFPLLDDEIRRHRETKQTFAVLMIDVDKFKNINDKYGHLAGDKVINSIGHGIKSRLREEDLIGRFGGDEFCVILPRAPRDKALQIAQRIKNTLSEIVFTSGGKEFRITISLGLAMFPQDARSRKSLIEKADEALYKAKSTGRNEIIEA